MAEGTGRNRSLGWLGADFRHDMSLPPERRNARANQLWDHYSVGADIDNPLGMLMLGAGQELFLRPLLANAPWLAEAANIIASPVTGRDQPIFRFGGTGAIDQYEDEDLSDRLENLRVEMAGSLDEHPELQELLGLTPPSEPPVGPEPPGPPTPTMPGLPPGVQVQRPSFAAPAMPQVDVGSLANPSGFGTGVGGRARRNATPVPPTAPPIAGEQPSAASTGPDVIQGSRSFNQLISSAPQANVSGSDEVIQSATQPGRAQQEQQQLRGSGLTEEERAMQQGFRSEGRQMLGDMFGRGGGGMAGFIGDDIELF